MEYLDSINRFLNKILLIIGGVAVLALMLLATGNVVLRLFQVPFRGAYELVAFLGAIVIAFSLGYTQKRKDHIVVDILTERFPKKLSRVLDGVNYFITMIFFSIVAWQTYLYGMKIWQEREVSETLKMIFHPFVFAVSLGFALLAFTLLVDLIKTIAGPGEE